MTRLINVDALLNETVKKNSVWNSITNASGETLEQIVNRLQSEPCEDVVSRQAVLDKIYNVDGMEEFENSNIFAKHYADIVKALPSVTPKPIECEDAISRKALKNAIRDGVREKKNESLFDTIDNMPSVNPTPDLSKIRAEIAEIPKKYPMTMDYENGLKEALGIIDKYKAESNSKMLVCPACGLDVHSHFKTCPRCGVKMESEDK